jgi:hypothetical protein
MKDASDGVAHGFVHIVWSDSLDRLASPFEIREWIGEGCDEDRCHGRPTSYVGEAYECGHSGWAIQNAFVDAEKPERWIVVRRCAGRLNELSEKWVDEREGKQHCQQDCNSDSLQDG